MAKIPVTVAYGDGIGPEIMRACLHIIQSAGAELELEEIKVGEQVYLAGNMNGIEDGAFDSLRRTKVFYKAPLTTPQGSGFKSVNVTTRKMFGLYANVRPSVSYAPYVDTKHPNMDLVIIRENEEDLYAGIEYRMTDEVVHAVKLFSRPGSEKIVRYAFEYARTNNRKKVTCFTKDNIMKMTDGMFHKIFDEVAAEYPDIQNEHWIVDIGSAKMADTPEAFDVLVLPNLYGDILSDVAAQIAGSVGLAGSANIGDGIAMFEAIHGSAPRRANQNLANPSGLLLGGVMMLVHIGQPEIAERVHNAWLRTLEEGIHTYDIFQEGVSKQKVGTKEFADAVVANLGKTPENLKPASYKKDAQTATSKPTEVKASKKEIIGVDVFVENAKVRNADEFGPMVEKANGNGLKLKLMSNRGQKVYPDVHATTFTSDQWRCRFTATDGTVTDAQIFDLLRRISELGIQLHKMEYLRTFDGVNGFTAAQGE
jgi:isocitrate dehydrogenase